MKNLSDLVVGDKVIITFCGDRIISTVDKVTDILIFAGHSSYSKTDGVALIGGRRDPTNTIEVATKEKINDILRDRLKDEVIQKIEDFDFDVLSYEQLKQINQILDSK